jgi:hypothetical protein
MGDDAVNRGTAQDGERRDGASFTIKADRWPIDGPDASRSDGRWWPLACHAPSRGAPSCDALELLICAVRGAVPPELRPDAGSAGPTRHYAPTQASPNSNPLSDPHVLNAYTSDCTDAVPLRIELMGETAFTAATGLPVPPLKPDSTYGGRRLP